MPVAQFRNKTGPEGPQGPKGDKGDDGLSAYQVWLSAGNKGSVDDFFEYIRGPKGKNGKDGKDGKDAKVFAYGRGPSSGGSGGASALDDLTDVTITAPNPGDVLSYNGTQWVNSASSSGLSLDVLKTLSATLSALVLVVADGPNSVAIADRSSYDTSQVLGVLLTAGNAGSTQLVRTFGELADASFAFPLNANLFLGPSGILTDAVPNTGHHVLVGKSLGMGKIFIDIEQPIVL